MKYGISENQNIAIREFNEADAEFIYANWAESDSIKLVSFPKDMDGIKSIISEWNTHKLKDKSCEVYVVTDMERPVCIAAMYGIIGIEMDLCVTTDEHMRKKGYARIAVAFLEWRAKELECVRVLAKCGQAEFLAQGLLDACGYKRIYTAECGVYRYSKMLVEALGLLL